MGIRDLLQTRTAEMPDKEVRAQAQQVVLYFVQRILGPAHRIGRGN